MRITFVRTYRNYFLDFDSFGLMSALEQNFNPSTKDVQRRSELGMFYYVLNVPNIKKMFFSLFLGYPQLLSGDMTSRHVIEIPKKKQTNLFTDTEADQPWTKTDHVKRYHLSFPFYPFRTLCPRALDQMLKSSESDSTSPLIPANTQLNFVFHKRKKTNFLQNMIIFNLNETLGTDRNTLTEAQFNAAVKITLPEGNPVANVDYSISKVDIKVQAMYLQVSFLKTFFYYFYL